MAAPDNYIPLTNDQRSAYNDFMDHVDKIGGAIPEPEKHFDDFKKENPKTKLTADLIPHAQYEVGQLKTGNEFAGLEPHELKYAQDAMTPAYKNGTNPKYPVTADGKHVDEFAKGKGTPPPVVNTVPGVTPNPGTVPPANTVPNAIPRPQNFDDPKATQEYRNALYKKYGPYVKDNADLPENLDYIIQGEKSSLGDITNNAASKLGIKPALLYSSAMQEGMRGLIPTAKNKGQTDYSGDDKFPISGYTSFGLDRFSDMFPELEKKGYLPKGFEQNFKKSVEKPLEGDNKTAVNSANFKNIDSAMQAKAAVLKNTYDHLDDIVKEEKIPLSDKARDFFALVAFNAGEGNARKMLKSYYQKGYLKNDKFLDKQPDSSWSGPYKNVIQRIKGAEMLKGEGYF